MYTLSLSKEGGKRRSSASRRGPSSIDRADVLEPRHVLRVQGARNKPHNDVFRWPNPIVCYDLRQCPLLVVC